MERPIYDAAVETARAVAGKTEVGPADVEGRQIGPVVSGVQFNRIQYYLKEGIDEGARLVAGGMGKPDGLSTGHFVRPDGLCRCHTRHDHLAGGNLWTGSDDDTF